MTATTKASAMQLLAKIDWNSDGNWENMPCTCVKPMPMVKLRAAMAILRCVKPASAIIWKPESTIVPNIMMVQPPSTACGSELNTAAMPGTKLASTRIRPPERITLRLTTLVIATSPIFCANDVSGRQPNRPETLEIRPSPAIAPAVSRSEGARLRPTFAKAAVSPSTSTEDTTYNRAKEMIAPASNCTLNGMTCGALSTARFWNPEKSTLPMNKATT